MKKVTVFLLFIFFRFELWSQITFSESVANIGREMRPVIFTEIDAEPAPLVKDWRGFLRSQYKIKTRNRRGVISATGVAMNDVSDKALDIFTIIKETPAGSRFEVALSFGQDNFLTPASNTAEMQSMKNMLDGFLKKHLSEHYSKKIAEKEKSVRSLERATTRLENDNRKLENRIAKDKRTVEQAAKRLEDNGKLLEENKLRIPENRSIIEEKKKRILELMNQRSNLYQN